MPHGLHRYGGGGVCVYCMCVWVSLGVYFCVRVRFYRVSRLQYIVAAQSGFRLQYSSVSEVLKWFLLLQQNGWFKMRFFVLFCFVFRIFGFECVFSANSAIFFDSVTEFVFVLVRSKVRLREYLCQRSACACVYNYECTVSDGSALSAGMFIRWCDLDFQPPTDC